MIQLLFRGALVRRLSKTLLLAGVAGILQVDGAVGRALDGGPSDRQVSVGLVFFLGA